MQLRWTWILAIVGLAVGTIIGLSLAQTVDASAIGGTGVQLLLQATIFKKLAGFGLGLGAIIGVLVDAVANSISDAIDEREHSTKYTKPLFNGSVDDAYNALDARAKREVEGRAAGMSDEEIEAQETAIRLEQEAHASDQELEQLRRAAEGPRFNWPNG